MRASTRLYAICKGGGRRNASTCSPTVPRGDTPCVTAGDAQRANPWKVDKPTLRHWRCRTATTPAHLTFSLNACSATPPASEFSLSSFHGFTLRASPAVKHGAPPPEARVDLCGCSIPAVRRLRRRREYLCVDAAEEERWYEHLQTYAICKGGGWRNASTYSPTVPRGDTLCVTAGDAQRANPWKVDKTILRHRRCRTAATPYPYRSYSLRACNTEIQTVREAINTTKGENLSTCEILPSIYSKMKGLFLVF